MDPKAIIIFKNGNDTEFWYGERSAKSIVALGSNTKRVFESRGLVPMSVRGQGEKAVRQYVEEAVKEDIARQQLVAAWEDYFAANAKFPVVARAADGRFLWGRILSIKNGKMSVRLDKPSKYQGTSTINCYGSGLFQGNLFNQDVTGFSEEVIATAQNELIKIYQRFS